MKTLLMISRAHADTAFRLAKEEHNNGSTVNILFIGRGTHHISDKKTLERLGFARLFTFEDEFNSTKEEVEAISYEKFIQILEDTERTISWI